MKALMERSEDLPSDPNAEFGEVHSKLDQLSVWKVLAEDLSTLMIATFCAWPYAARTAFVEVVWTMLTVGEGRRAASLCCSDISEKLSELAELVCGAIADADFTVFADGRVVAEADFHPAVWLAIERDSRKARSRRRRFGKSAISVKQRAGTKHHEVESLVCVFKALAATRQKAHDKLDFEAHIARVSRLGWVF